MDKKKVVSKIKQNQNILPALAFLVFSAIVLFFFWKAVIFAFAVIAVAFVVLVVILKLWFRKPNLKHLFAEKNRILQELRIAEHKYMKRKMSEKDFNNFFKERQKQLIALEALIDQKYNKSKSVEITKELEAVQAKKRHILKGLLEEKRRVIKEMDLAEKRYLKRKLDAKTYQALVQKNQDTLIQLEAQIKHLYSEANIQKVMDSLKERLSDLEGEKRDNKKKKEKGIRAEELQIASDIADQLSKR